MMYNIKYWCCKQCTHKDHCYENISDEDFAKLDEIDDSCRWFYPDPDDTN